MGYKGYVSKEAYLKSEKMVEERRKQIVGYQDGEKTFTHSRDYYQVTGLILAFAAFIMSHLYAPIGLILFGLALFFYFGGPSKYAKRIYLHETIKWQNEYRWLDNNCPECGANVRIEHHLVTECVCNLQLCAFGAIVKTARKEGQNA